MSEAEIPTPKETVLFAFSDLPVRIIWITRKGKTIREQVIRENDAPDKD